MKSIRSRTVVLLAGLAVLGLALARLGSAQTDAAGAAAKPGARTAPAAPLTEIKIVERVQRSIDRALDYLKSRQRPDGAWVDNNAVNAVALLAFLGRGHVPGRGPYRDVLERGKKFLLARARADGFLGFSTMYEHGLATLALAEMYGMDPDPLLEAKLRKAVDLIVRCQSAAGGWRYNPAPGDQDLSVTVMQIVALRAANNALIPVPDKTIQNAVGYVMKCYSPAGGFGYQGPGGGPQTTAAGILSLQLIGKPGDAAVSQAVARSLDYLGKVPIQWGTGPAPGGPTYFFYFHYYAIQASYQAGGQQWNEWHPRIRELLLEHQSPDGSWDVPPGSAEAPHNTNRIYGTAMGCLVLDIYTHFLPAYQR